MEMTEKKVLIVMGSDSDLPVMEKAKPVFERFGVAYEMRIASAHRSPKKVVDLASAARENGFGAIISGAGMAAHLGGVIAAHTTLPVIGVPLASGTLGGTDAMLANLQMPPGIPIATVGIGAAYNAALTAVAILAVGDSDLASRLDAYRAELAQKVEEKDAALQQQK
jgi:5-(carboxyamino)imidazole ribonucleotide mutase